MKISLIQEEIEDALREYILNQGIQISNKEVLVEFTAGRGERGISADLNILPKNLRKGNGTESPKPDLSVGDSLQTGEEEPICEGAG